jgi:hypothetical protein
MMQNLFIQRAVEQSEIKRAMHNRGNGHPIAAFQVKSSSLLTCLRYPPQSALNTFLRNQHGPANRLQYGSVLSPRINMSMDKKMRRLMQSGKAFSREDRCSAIFPDHDGMTIRPTEKPSTSGPLLRKP